MTNDDWYPEKPAIKEKKNNKRDNLAMTIFTMALFVVSFLLVFADSLMLVLGLVGVLVIHELGHFALMKKFKYKNVRMLFVPLMGAFVQGIKDKYSQWQSFMVVLAGPIPGVLVGLALFFVAQHQEQPVIMSLSILFLSLNVMNLLPLDPLDGGQLLKLLVRKNQDLFQLVFSLMSSLILIGVGWYLDSWLFMGFGFFMAFRVRQFQKNHYIRKELKDEDINIVSTYENLSNKEYAQIKAIIVDHNSNLRKYLEDNAGEEDLEPFLATQVKNILIPPMKFDTSLLNRVGIVVLWLICVFFPIYLFLTQPIDWYVEFIVRNWY